MFAYKYKSLAPSDLGIWSCKAGVRGVAPGPGLALTVQATLLPWRRALSTLSWLIRGCKWHSQDKGWVGMTPKPQVLFFFFSEDGRQGQGYGLPDICTTDMCKLGQ